jgi:hopanoid-associated phosphorylase
MLREARVVEGPGARAVAGGGRCDLLRERLQATAEGADAVISIGVGGALDPALKVGDVVIGAEVIAGASHWPTDAAWSARLAARLPGALSAAIYGSEVMVLRAADKESLRAASGAALADMESHIAAEVAAAHGLPFTVVRVVSDTAEADLPSAVAAGLKPDGAMNLVGVLAALALRPLQLPALMRVGRDAEAALKALEATVAALGVGLSFPRDGVEAFKHP